MRPPGCGPVPPHNRQQLMNTPDQVAYQCDDGVTYWKNAR